MGEEGGVIGQGVVSCRYRNGQRTDRWIFVFGFEKNDRANVTNKELEALKLLAGDLLSLSMVQIAEAVNSGHLLEVTHETRES